MNGGAVIAPIKRKRVRPVESLPAQRLFSIRQAAAYLGRTERAIRLMQHKGALPFIKLDGKVQFDRLDLDSLIEKNKKCFTY